ncbi:MAG: RusA family crossover junction endodeoxyribonuclease [Nitrospirota bacterium]|nr:MAG: RusA family crossover junction endodeoxyribonuclease [Nitrospirota bacterium]
MPSTGSYHSTLLSSTQVTSLSLLKRKLPLGKTFRGSQKPPSLLMAFRRIHPQSIVSSRTAVGGFPQETLLSITTKKLVLALPVPPSINHQYATVNGRRVLSSKGRRYKANVAQQILAALMRSSERMDLLKNLRTDALKLSIRFFFTSALRRDIDGGLKIAQDAICDALDINDNRIVEIHLYKAIDANCPRMECSLSITPTKTKLPKTRTSKNTKFQVKRTSPRHHSIPGSGRVKSHTIRQSKP